MLELKTMTKRKRLLWQLPFLAFLIIGTVMIVRRQNNAEFRNNHGTVFGTTYNITYQCGANLDEGIKTVLQEVDNALSPFNPHSVITAVNENRKVTLNKMFTEVFNHAMEVSAVTGGAFDITVAPLVNHWGFGFKTQQFPDKHDIDSIMQFVGYERVRLNNGTIIKDDPRLMLDCSSIAKGYGCDKVAEYLRSKGVENYMVEIGGEIVIKGNNPRGQAWKIGVNKPVDDSLAVSHDLQAVLNISDCAMATSGNYRNFYIRNGKRYAHTVDPKTGYPVQHSILSATVIAPDCTTADAYATAFMVMGLDRAKALLDRRSDIMAYLICSGVGNENTVWCSPRLERMLDK